MTGAATGRLHFTLEATAANSSARAARFTTQHHEVLTPTFMPVGTHAAVRSQRREDLLESGAQVLLANTYHLLLRPGLELFEKFGGIRGFMNWPRAVLTDSGGYQIFSLPGSRTLCEDYAEFVSYTDSSADSIESGTQHRDAEGDRRRHHDGARSMRALDGGARRGPRRDAADASLGAAQPGGARRLARRRCSASCRARATRTCASRAPKRHRANAFRRLCHRRPRGRRERRAARGLHRHRDRIFAAGLSAIPDGRRHHARLARSRASGRRHVRLHSADLARQARCGIHEFGQARSAARRLSRHGRPHRSRLRIATPARPTRSPICFICSACTKSPDGNCSVCTISISTCN